MYILILIVIAIVVIAAYRYGRKKATVAVQVQIQPPEIITSQGESPRASDGPNQESIEKDAWEGSFWEATDPFPVEATLRIEYADSNGRQTERVVDVRQFDETLYGGMIIGFCRLRQATRTFRIDRISRCRIEGTGEDVDDVRKFLRNIYENSVHSTTDKLLDEEFNFLRTLLYVGKADGRLSKKEVDVIAEACRDLIGDERITGEVLGKMLNEMQSPSLTAFRLAVGKLASLPEERRLKVIQQAERIVSTQKAVHPAEQDAIAYLKRKLTNIQPKATTTG